MNRTSIAVVLGGPSAEHDVSLVSGRAIAEALKERGHDVTGWLIDLRGGWWQLPGAGMDNALPATAYDDPAALAAEGPLPAGIALEKIRGHSNPAPVLFIALHGPFGEDGTVQALAESAGLVYTGAGVAASAIGMDKALFKRITSALGMPTVPGWSFRPRSGSRTRRRPRSESLSSPRRCPTSESWSSPHAWVRRWASPSSTSRQDPEYPGGAITEALSYGQSALVEAYLDHARELEMSVLGNSEMDIESYGPGEIFPGHEFYDYTAKYSDGVSRTTDRADVSPEIRAQIHEQARRAYLAIGTTGFARVDFLMDKQGALFLNEINTIPGFTPISLFPVLCREGGYDFGSACSSADPAWSRRRQPAASCPCRRRR